jgi:hypothetical protein
MKRALAAVLATLCGLAHAEGPGSRIRSGSTVEIPSFTRQATELRCDRLRAMERERCLREVRMREEAADPKAKASGAESTGMSSGAATGATTGTSGGASFGSAAPR